MVGHRDVPGRPAMLATTKIFLDYFDLKSLQDLPPLSEIQELYESETETNLSEELSQSRILDMPDVEESQNDIMTLSEDHLLAEEEAIELSKKPLDEILGEDDSSESADDASKDQFDDAGNGEEGVDRSNVFELPLSEKIEHPDVPSGGTQGKNDQNVRIDVDE